MHWFKIVLMVAIIIGVITVFLDMMIWDHGAGFLFGGALVIIGVITALAMETTFHKWEIQEDLLKSGFKNINHIRKESDSGTVIIEGKKCTITFVKNLDRWVILKKDLPCKTIEKPEIATIEDVRK